MNENEKKYEEELSPLPEISESAPTEVTTAAEAQAPELPREDAPAYRWDFSEAPEVKRARKKHRSALIYAAVMTGAFVISFAVLLVLLLTNVMRTSGEPSSIGGGLQNFFDDEDRIVYVREYDSESGVLTTQEIYDKCLPSVVTISVIKNDDRTGVGSGFIISEDGYIITANHVIEDTASISVVLSDGRFHTAKVIDGNDFTDIALIKIDAEGLTPMEIGSSSDLLVGDSVVAIGTPAATNFAGSLTTGHVSYLDRLFKVSDGNGGVEKIMTFIQTNALVNPGNSGCPLINEYGEAVGLVTMKLNSSYYEGMCFAIPIDAVMPIINAMKNGEDYTHMLGAVSTYPAKIGVQISEVTISSTGDFGIRIDQFISNSYDAARKLKVGDIITHINGVKFNTSAELSILLDKCSPGETVSVTYYRDGQYQEIYIILGR